MNARAVSPSLDDSLLRSFVDALPDPCVVIDGAGFVLAVNRAWRELPRRKEATVAASNPVGIDYLALFQSSTADDGVSRALAGIKAVLSGQREHFEHEYIRPMPPTFRWFRMTVHPWREFGTNAIIFHRDITAESFGRLTPQTVDQEFRSLADAAPVMIWMSGPDKACIFVSRQWLEFTGGRLEDALGDRWPQFVHPDDRDALRALSTQPSTSDTSSPMNIACDTKMAAIAGSGIADRHVSMRRTSSWVSLAQCGT